jgi:hypothetical protein
METWVYLDLSVIAGCFDSECAEPSNALFDNFMKERFIPCVSDMTLAELDLAPPNVARKYGEIADRVEILHFDQDVDLLAKKYLKEADLSGGLLFEMQQLAAATIHRVDVVVSWDFELVVCLPRIRIYNSVNLRNGYPFMEIRSPRELWHAT